jgi:large subunit ribosomal protein L20
MRTRKGAARTQAKKRLLQRAKGYVGGRRRLYRTAKESVARAGAFAYRDRRNKKRTFRALWIVRLNAACRERGIAYSRFVNGLKKAQIELDRKSLSEIAIVDPKGFDKIVEAVKKALAA